MQNYFTYQSVVSISGEDINNHFLRNKGPEYFIKNKILTAIYNHRFFDLHDKNYIKALIERFDLEHLVFSLRPSSKRFIDNTSNIDYGKFKALSQVIFILQCMARYNIPEGYILRDFISYDGTSIEAEKLLDIMELWLDELTLTLKENNKYNAKMFCSLFSIRNQRKSLIGKIVRFQDSEIVKYDSNLLEGLDMHQISPLEKDIFWIGFDPNYKEVPWDKEYKETKYTRALKDIPVNSGYYQDKLHYCNRCVMPETMEGITFDELGICNVCQSSEEKMHINWEERQKNLGLIFDNFRRDDYYDCMLPMSGGKDSSFQAYVLRYRYNVECLAVTHGHNMHSLTGRYNLENCLQKFDYDHIIYVPNRSAISKAARNSLTAIGDACWHCHIGAGTFPIQSSIKWDLKLMIWGESIAEFDGRSTYYKQKEANPFYNLEVSARVTANEMVSNDFTEKELNQWFYPSKEDLTSAQMRYLHLGDFIFWDEEKHVDFLVRNFEWMDSKVENAYKGYKSTECVIAGVHDYLNFLKRGIGRATWHASDDVRRGLITREEGFELAKKHDTQRPHALDYYMSITNYTEEEIEEEIIKAREKSDFASKLNKT